MINDLSTVILPREDYLQLVFELFMYKLEDKWFIGNDKELNDEEIMEQIYEEFPNLFDLNLKDSGIEMWLNQIIHFIDKNKGLGRQMTDEWYEDVKQYYYSMKECERDDREEFISQLEKQFAIDENVSVNQ